jgi:hypothetical protein
MTKVRPQLRVEHFAADISLDLVSNKMEAERRRVLAFNGPSSTYEAILKEWELDYIFRSRSAKQQAADK